MTVTTMNLCHGSKVWVEDRDSTWELAEVLDSHGNQLLLVTNSDKKKLFLRDADEEEHGGFKDMTRLAYLNKPKVLFNIWRRYALNDIYWNPRTQGFPNPPEKRGRTRGHAIELKLKHSLFEEEANEGWRRNENEFTLGQFDGRKHDDENGYAH
ncbi:hypothetical protein VNO78_21072 [Psophocarpus tetragonolobus]|uniref:Uncharacterized protein n=1 Tax=Psophocarpus tetragonolobus TaxID=3891 RepID=A0AAN9SEJ5_PSOTE